MPAASEPLLLSVALVVPPPWFEAAAAISHALVRAFPDLPPQRVAPHISLRQSFRAADPARAGQAVERALRGLRPAPIAVGDVQPFRTAEGSVEVVFLAVGGAWLRLAHSRIMRETASVALPPPSGEPAFELAGFQPHVTVAVPRDLSGPPARQTAVLTRAEALWPALRPAGAGFLAEEVLLSRWQPEDSGEPLRRFRLD